MSEHICLVLGAGFSRAVSHHMPVTDELGELALKALSPDAIAIPTGGFANGYFETWLSRLAEPQPDLRDDENLHNQAAFVSISRAVRDILVKQQSLVMASPPKIWLERFLRIAHAERFSIISFNYDSLLEAAIDEPVPIYVRTRGNIARVYSNALLKELPPEPWATRANTTSPLPNTFRLLKLHGSVDSWWVNGDVSGATIVRTPDGWTGEAEGYGGRGAVPARTPCLIPPSSGKSRFYNNPLTRELWQQAAAALQEASTVALLGYSFPPTDLVTVGMFADRLRGSATRIDVVNPHPRAPVESLHRIGLKAETVYTSVEDYVHHLEGQSAGRATRLPEVADDTPVLVGTSDDNLAAVTDTQADPRGIRLITQPFINVWPRSPQGEPDLPITVGELRRRAVNAQQFVVEISQTEQASIIGWQEFHVSVGHANHWAIGVLSVAPATPAE